MNRSSHRYPSSSGAFTLLELMIVVSILSIISALAMPTFKRILNASRAGVMANDLRVYAQAFQTYAQQNTAYPPDTGTKAMPAGMNDLLGPGWMAPTPIGGYYNYEYRKKAKGTRYTAAIGIRNKGKEKVTTDADLLLAIDRLIDDGNLATGTFLLGPGNAPFHVIER